MTTMEAAPLPTLPRVCLSHEGTAGSFLGSDVRCIDCSFFHFSLRDPVWQQRQSRTENSNLDQTWRKIILEARSGDTVRVRRHPDSIFCAGVLQKRRVQHDYFRWQPFFALKLAGIQICRRAQSPSPIQRVVCFIRNRWLVAEICPFPVFDTRPRPN